MDQMQFFYEIFDPSLPRLGPGEDVWTKQAFEMLFSDGRRAKLAEKLRILDMGCGNGAQTIQLAKLSGGDITALDNHPPFLEELSRRAAIAGVSQKIRPYLRDMSNSGLSERSFDLVWSEGALFCMGFNDGLSACRSLLEPGGLMAVTELTWFKPDPPGECRQFFEKAYPPMVGTEENLAAIESRGFTSLGHFNLPESAWLNSYYRPLEDRLNCLKEQYGSDAEKLELINAVGMEMEIYRKYSSYYGYTFFLMQRPLDS